ncbi:MAG: methionine adenosyltransferase, partial [Candidatus Asgardarchaeia archaeon]
DDYNSQKVYLTVTGLSAEMGDDGEVGRGNRVNGLITPYRMMSLEAAAGKNPVNHVGKIYNVLANEVCKDIVAQHEGVREATFTIVSEIGKPINEPKAADLQVKLHKGYTMDMLKDKLRYIVDVWLENIEEITERIVYGGRKVY